MLIVSLYQKDKDNDNDKDNADNGDDKDYKDKGNADNGDDKDHSQRASKPSRAAEAMAAGRGETVKLLRGYFILVFSPQILTYEVATS